MNQTEKADSLFQIPSVDLEKVTFNWQGKAYAFRVLRLDQISHEASGNKLFKLKYNVYSALQTEHNTILTFGGAWSNHIQATSSVCKKLGLKCIGVIRGEEPKILSNTLINARLNGMSLKFVSRGEYKEKDQDFFKAWLRDEFGSFHLVPEGGSNFLGVQGCMEIVDYIPEDASDVFLAAGTGCTVAGILLGGTERVHAVSALKGGEFLRQEIENQVYWSVVSEEMTKEVTSRMNLITESNFGGYAKFTPELIRLIRDFYSQTGIKTEPIYSGKALHALLSELEKGEVENDGAALLIHTGGLQGISGIEKRLGQDLFQ